MADSLAQAWSLYRGLPHGQHQEIAATQRFRSLPTSSVELSEDPVAAWLLTFSNHNTIVNYGRDIRNLFATTGAMCPADLTDGAILQWANGNGKLANNSVRSRLSATVSFLRWCRENGLAAMEPSRVARLARRYPKIYGKKQGHRPARWLTRSRHTASSFPPARTGRNSACETNSPSVSA